MVQSRSRSDAARLPEIRIRNESGRTPTSFPSPLMRYWNGLSFHQFRTFDFNASSCISGPMVNPKCSPSPGLEGQGGPIYGVGW